MHGALGDTLAAGLALGEVDIGHIIGHRDGLEGTHLGTLSTSNTSILAGLHSHSTFLLVDAADIDATTLVALVAKLDDTTRTGLGAGTAGRTFLFVDHRGTCLGIHVDGIKLTGGHAVATSQTSERAAVLTGVDRRRKGTTAETVVVRTSIFTAVGGMTAYHCHLRFALLDSAAEEFGNPGRHSVATGGATQTLQAMLGHAGLSKSATASLATAAAVGAGENLGHFINQWVFDHLEFLGYKIEHHGKEGAYHA
jgi:hypothetical protein